MLRDIIRIQTGTVCHFAFLLPIISFHHCVRVFLFVRFCLFFPLSSSSQTWEKVNIKENPNGTISYNQKRVYIFNEDLSGGLEDDVVIVPNIPMLSATSQSKHAAR